MMSWDPGNTRLSETQIQQSVRFQVNSDVSAITLSMCAFRFVSFAQVGIRSVGLGVDRVSSTMRIDITGNLKSYRL